MMKSGVIIIIRVCLECGNPYCNFGPSGAGGFAIAAFLVLIIVMSWPNLQLTKQWLEAFRWKQLLYHSGMRAQTGFHC